MMKEEFKENKFSFIDKAIFYLVFGVWLFLDQDNKIITYFPFVLLFIYFLTNIIFRRKGIGYYNKLFKYFPFFLILAWLYGVILGLLFGNDNVFINNIGIIFFGSYYFISRNELTTNQLYRILINLIGISLFYYLLDFGDYISKNISYYQLGQRIGYNSLGIFTITLFPLLLYNLFFRSKENLLIKKFYINAIFFILIFIVGILFTASKGVYLSVVVTLFLLIILKIRTLKWPLLVLLLFFVFFYLNIDFSVLTIFGENDISNRSRYEMLESIIPELTFFGEGWGARFTNSFIEGRDSAGYSTELSYLNLIHKIGFVSVVFFIFYSWTIFHVVKLLSKKNIALFSSGIISLGLITYLFISIGNPSLFAPIFVFMNVLALHIINKQLMDIKYSHQHER